MNTYKETCCVCCSTFLVNKDSNLKGTKTCSPKCYRTRKQIKDRERYAKRYPSKKEPSQT